MRAPLRICPIAISGETKPLFSGGDTADVQLAIWVGAGLTKLHQLLPPDQTISKIPTLAAHRHELHLLNLQEKGDENTLDGRLRLGSTETLL